MRRPDCDVACSGPDCEGCDKFRGMQLWAVKRILEDGTVEWQTNHAYIWTRDLEEAACWSNKAWAAMWTEHEGELVEFVPSSELAAAQKAHALVCDSLASIQDEQVAPLQAENCRLAAELAETRLALGLAVHEGFTGEDRTVQEFRAQARAEAKPTDGGGE